VRKKEATRSPGDEEEGEKNKWAVAALVQAHFFFLYTT
jgi:hypothetical protein